jgi:hypothetical protein
MLAQDDTFAASSEKAHLSAIIDFTPVARRLNFLAARSHISLSFSMPDDADLLRLDAITDIMPSMS